MLTSTPCREKKNVYCVALFIQLLRKVKFLSKQVVTTAQAVTVRFGWQYLVKHGP